MPRIPEDTLERIKSACEIVDVVSQHVQLNKRGRRFFGLCPFHTEKTPSFTVNPDLQIFHCFGCDTGGDVFRFIQEIDRVSFPEAVTFLAARAGIQLQPDRDGGRGEVADKLYRANELAGKFYHYMLRQKCGAGALKYLRDRGLSDETIDRFWLGYAPPGWRDFLDVARPRGFDADVVEQAGLALPGRNRPGHYDRFRDRVIFPIINLSGRTVGFGARALRPDDEPKYLNSPETPIYHKSSVLYGLNWTRDEVRQGDCAIVVEGYMDLLSIVQAGVAPVVATSGTALTEHHCRILARYAQRAVLLFDGDAAGSAAAGRGIEVLLATGLDSRVVALPAGSDPDSFVRKEGVEALRDAVEGATTALDFFLNRLALRSDLSTVAGKAQAVKAVIPLFERCQESVRRDLMLRQVAQRLEIDERALREDLRSSLKGGQSIRPGGESDSAPESETALPDPSRREREFMALLLQHPRYISPTSRQLSPETFADPRIQRLAILLFDRCGDTDHLDMSLLISDLDAPLVSLISACAVVSFDEEQIDSNWRESLLQFQRADLTRQIEQSRRLLRAAVEGGVEGVKVARISASMNRLIRDRQELDAGEQP